MRIEYNFLRAAKPTIVLDECQEALQEAFDYISLDSPKQAEMLLTQFTETRKMIQRMPRIGTAYEKGIRKIKLGKFRYNIYYKETKTAIEILGIWHTSKGTKF